MWRPWVNCSKDSGRSESRFPGRKGNVLYYIMSLTGEKRLAIILLVTVLIMAGEMVGGFLSNSLALLSDAGHMVTDALAIVLGLVAHNHIAFSAHVLVDDRTLGEVETTRKGIENMLKDAGVHHSTLQMECSCAGCDNSLYCRSRPCDEDNTHYH